MKNRLTKSAAVWAAMLLIAPRSHTFNSTGQVETFTARVVVQGIAPAAIQIRHTSLLGASSITKKVIIQGEVGTRPRTPPDFSARITLASPRAVVPPERDVIRVTLNYRIANPDGTFSAVISSPTFEGPDPMAFAFQVNPDDVGEGSIQYQLIAERWQGNPRVVVRTAAFPAGAPADPDAWATVGLDAQAADVFAAEGGQLIIPDGNPNDGQSTVNIPANAFQSPVRVSFTEVPLGSPFAPQAVGGNTPLELYQLETDYPFNGTLPMSILYQDFTFPTGQDGILDGTSVLETAVSVAWWDGARWRNLHSTRNTTLNTLSFRATNGMKLFAIVPTATLSLNNGRPLDKVITPNGDGINDTLIFDLTAGVRIEIFDVTGRRVRTLSTVDWNGRDDSGDIVESGVYIYQYSDSGQRISGVVAVAK